MSGNSGKLSGVNMVSAFVGTGFDNLCSSWPEKPIHFIHCAKQNYGEIISVRTTAFTTLELVQNHGGP